MPSFDFSHLRTVLSGLPLPVVEPSALHFRTYTPSHDGLEKTESINGAVNDDLEKLLGYKAHGLTLSEAGPGVTALADVLESYTQMFPDDAVLKLWGPAVLAAAENVYVAAGKSVCYSVTKTRAHILNGIYSFLVLISFQKRLLS